MAISISSDRAGHPRTPVEQRWLRGMARQAARLQRWLRQARQRARNREALAQLDDFALRDLGMTRSELESVCAEAEGQAMRSRRRIALR
jgi:uncharacterized protein YjiS (DUF1127 family)